MSLHRIIVNSPENAASVAEAMSSAADSKVAAARLESYVTALNGGAKSAYMEVNTGAIRAAGSVTFTGRPTADQTMLVLNTTLTAKDSGANGTTQFNTSASDVAVTATNLAACINANTTLNKQVSATSAAGVVTITAKVPGVVGNGLQLSEGMDNTTASAFATGSEGTSTTHSYGYPSS
jgi:phage tail sheath gpL-like